MKYLLGKIIKIICLQDCDLCISNDTQIIAKCYHRPVFIIIFITNNNTFICTALCTTQAKWDLQWLHCECVSNILSGSLGNTKGMHPASTDVKVKTVSNFIQNKTKPCMCCSALSPNVIPLHQSPRWGLGSPLWVRAPCLVLTPHRLISWTHYILKWFLFYFYCCLLF